MRRTGLLLGIGVVAVTADVTTKVLVVAKLEGQRIVDLGPLHLHATRNSGAAFSFAQGSTWFFTVFALAVVGLVLYNARRVRSAWWALSLGLLLGGAIGNLVDRAFRSPGVGRGAVVDFLELPHWPTFNVADSCIVVGGILAVLVSLTGRELDGSRTPARDRTP
jgi:signal peptidase II